VGELAASRKSAKYANLEQSRILHLPAFKNLGSMNEFCYTFLSEISASVMAMTLEAGFFASDYRSHDMLLNVI